MAAIGTLLILIVLWALAYSSAKAIVWVLLPPALLVSLQLGGLIGIFGATVSWVAYGTCMFFYLLPDLRLRLISGPLLRQFRRVMPAMSSTEREALHAGNVWWDGELFSGQPEWQRLLEQPEPQLTEQEQAFIDGPVERLCKMLDDWQITHHDMDLPEAVWSFIKQSGLFGMIIPRAYGGLEFSALAHSTIVMKISSRSIAAAVTVMVPNSLGPAKLLLHYGTQTQKDRYLRRLAKGEEIPCFALTGPDAGSDAGAIPDNGVVTKGEFNGQQILGIRLNWEKRYITLGPVATLIGLAFKLYDPDHLLGSDTSLGITVALIPSETKGVEIGQRHMPLNIPFQNGPIRGKDVFIPLDWVIGEQSGIGQGWRMLVESLSEGRGISLPALATGAGKAASRYTGTYAAVRRQFGQPIGNFEGVEEALSRIAGITYQMDSARLLTVSALDSGEKPSVISAIVKYHLTERYRQVVNDAMDIQGGSGICLGPRNLIGRVYQAIPIAITVEGANILTRSMIIFGQGAIRCHPYILQEFSAAHEKEWKHALSTFDKALFGHIGFLVTNLARTFWLGITHGRLSVRPVKGVAGHYFQQLNWMSAAFALSADLALMTLGGALKRKERLSARLGDLLSELYIASATLKHFIDEHQRYADIPLLQWAMEDSLYRMQEAFIGIFRNLPFRPLAWIVRLLAFPTGLPYHKPSDRLDHAVAGTILQPGEARTRLTTGIFLSNDLHEPVARLDQALQAAVASAPIEKTLRQARRAGQIRPGTNEVMVAEAVEIGIITESDAQLVLETQRLRDQVIQVDAFDSLSPTNNGKRKQGGTSIRHLGAA